MVVWRPPPAYAPPATFHMKAFSPNDDFEYAVDPVEGYSCGRGGHVEPGAQVWEVGSPGREEPRLERSRAVPVAGVLRIGPAGPPGGGEGPQRVVVEGGQTGITPEEALVPPAPTPAPPAPMLPAPESPPPAPEPAAPVLALPAPESLPPAPDLTPLLSPQLPPAPEPRPAYDAPGTVWVSRKRKGPVAGSSKGKAPRSSGNEGQADLKEARRGIPWPLYLPQPQTWEDYWALKALARRGAHAQRQYLVRNGRVGNAETVPLPRVADPPASAGRKRTVSAAARREYADDEIWVFGYPVEEQQSLWEVVFQRRAQKALAAALPVVGGAAGPSSPAEPEMEAGDLAAIRGVLQEDAERRGEDPETLRYVQQL